MPVWWVSEPYINLRLEDEPLGYQPSRGARVAFHLSYQQRGALPYDPASFSVGPNWSCSFQAFVRTNRGNVFCLHSGGAGLIDYTNGVPQARDGSILYTDGYGLHIEYADGSVDGFYYFGGEDGGIWHRNYSMDPYGNVLTYNFAWNNCLQLANVVDADGRTTQFYYERSDFPALITKVVDPFNRTNLLEYDANGYLTSIVDVAGITSSLTYDAGNPGWITNLYASAYGNTGFRYGGVDCNNSTFFTGGAGQVNRFIEVTLPTLGQHLYLYRQDCTNLMSRTYAAMPTTGSLANTLDNLDQWSRNSFHWGPLQHASLSTNYTQSGQPGNLTANDYNRAMLRHWLIDPYSGNAGAALSLERTPSPDAGGTIAGQLTWYDYAGKPAGSNNYAGSTELQSFIARVMPDGSSWYQNFQRNACGWPARIIEGWANALGPQSRTSTYTYAANAVDLLGATNALGVQSVANIFNGNHQVTSSFNALSELTSSTYDGSNRLFTVTAPSGLVTSNAYGADGFTAQTADLGLRTNSYTWAGGLVYTHANELGLTTTHYWDALQRPCATVYPDSTTLSNSYCCLDLAKPKDRLGYTNGYAYNGVRQRVWETNAAGVVTAYVYCECGALQYLTTAWGIPGVQAVTQFFYDNQGHLTQVIYPDATVVTKGYDSLGRLTSVNDGVGTTTSAYDNLGRLTTVSNAFGQVKAVAYDAIDRVTSATDANGVTAASTYDALDRILSRSYPDGGAEHYGYTANVTEPTSYTNQVGNTYFYGYDSAGRKTNEVCTGISTNRFAYDASGNLTALTDGNGHTTHWYYDQYSRLTSKVDALNNTVFTYQYNANGWLTNRNSLATGPTLYGYDNVGNLLSVTYQHSPPLTFGYDALNRVTNMVDGIGASTYSYDGAGQLLSEAGPWSGVSVSNVYVNRLRQSLSAQAPGAAAWTNGYGYDSARRLTGVTSGAGSFGYHFAPGMQGVPSGITLPNGASITDSYDSVARLLSTALKNSQLASLALHQYGYNLAGQRTNQTRLHGDYVTYTYDNAGELKTAQGKESGGSPSRLQEQFGYAYDAAGNLGNRTDNALVETFSVNAANELTTSVPSGTLTVAGGTAPPASSVAISGSASGAATLYADGAWALSGASLPSGSATYIAAAQWAGSQQATGSVSVYLPPSASYTYDLNGSLLSDGNRCFAYDDENQLVSVWVPDVWRTDFFYDGKMRLRQRVEYAWNASSVWSTNSTVRYVYDGNVVVQEQDQNNTPKVSYTRGSDLSGSLQGAGGIGGLLARTDNSLVTSAYYFADGNGNITCMLDGNQAVAASYLYDPYGRILSQSGWLANANLYRFSSKEFQINSGLEYYLYRFYDPNLQRWVNRDPIGERGGNNLYGFVKNDPQDAIDPRGLVAGCTWDYLKCAAAAAAATLICADPPTAAACALATASAVGTCGTAYNNCPGMRKAIKAILLSIAQTKFLPTPS